MGSGNKLRWKIFFHRSPSNSPTDNTRQQPPKEFLCLISGAVMSDPVIVSSGHTFERNSVEACLSLSFIPTLSDGSTPDFSTLIPNLALKSTILNWSRFPPKPLDFHSAQNLVRELKLKNSNSVKGISELTRTEIELSRWASHVSSSSSVESVTPTTPLPLTSTTRPFCYSSSSSSDVDPLTPNPTNSPEEEEIITKIKSCQVFQQEVALVSLRNITRTGETARTNLCTPDLLSNLRSLMTSRYVSVQVNSVAALVNLSLENTNKLKIVRAGIVPPLIDVLRGGFPEAQEHAAGALFSLSLDNQNKTAIGVLGALPPLLHALRSDSEGARNDSALALYHLTLVQSNRTKLVKFGSVSVLLDMVRSGHMTGRVLLVLGNLAGSVEGRAAMLNGGAVACFVGLLTRDEFDSEVTRESFVAALYGLSHGGLRFKGLAKEAGAEEVLRKVEEQGSKRARVKARRILEVMRERDEEEEEVVDWEKLLNSGELSRTRHQLVYGQG